MSGHCISYYLINTFGRRFLIYIKTSKKSVIFNGFNKLSNHWSMGCPFWRVVNICSYVQLSKINLNLSTVH